MTATAMPTQNTCRIAKVSLSAAWFRRPAEVNYAKLTPTTATAAPAAAARAIIATRALITALSAVVAAIQLLGLRLAAFGRPSLGRRLAIRSLRRLALWRIGSRLRRFGLGLLSVALPTVARLLLPAALVRQTMHIAVPVRINIVGAPTASRCLFARLALGR